MVIRLILAYHIDYTTGEQVSRWPAQGAKSEGCLSLESTGGLGTLFRDSGLVMPRVV